MHSLQQAAVTGAAAAAGGGGAAAAAHTAETLLAGCQQSATKALIVKGMSGSALKTDLAAFCFICASTSFAAA